jgi:hypothetical protein
MLIRTVLTSLLSFTLVSNAHAVSQSVKDACKTDYFAYCSAHPVDSEALRGCMRAVGTKLSSRCLLALVAAGEVSKSDVKRALFAKP